MRDRLTVRLDDANAEWLASEADDRDRSKAWVINQLLNAARGTDSAYPSAGGDSVTTEMTDGDAVTDDTVTGRHQHGDEVTTRLDDLEERLAELEAREAARDELAGDRFTVDEEGASEDETSPPP